MTVTPIRMGAATELLPVELEKRATVLAISTVLI
jgi:hypothetical protein